MKRKFTVPLLFLLLVTTFFFYPVSGWSAPVTIHTNSQNILSDFSVSGNVLAVQSFSFGNLIRPLLCIIVLLGIAWSLSSNRRIVSARMVISGLLLQFLLVAAVVYVPAVQILFEFLGKIFLKI